MWSDLLKQTNYGDGAQDYQQRTLIAAVIVRKLSKTVLIASLVTEMQTLVLGGSS